LWRGINKRNTDDISDYDRACRLVDDVAVIKIADAEVLVLGDEPFRTTWVQGEQGGLFIRWVYAHREEILVRLLDEMNLTGALRSSGVTFTTAGTCVLFDSAEPGDEIRGDSMALLLEPGTYEVDSAILDPSSEVRLLVHRLKLIS
jgi:hypothetical protein